MWDWIKTAADAVGTWAVENKRAIASTVIATVVAVAVGAVLAPAVVGLGTAIAVGCIVGMVGGGVGYVADWALTPKEQRSFNGKSFVKAIVIGGLVGALTGGVGKYFQGAVEKTAEVVASRVAGVAPTAVSQGAKTVVTTGIKKSADAFVGAGLGSGTQVVDNVIENERNGKPLLEDWDRNTDTAAALGAGSALIQGPLDRAAQMAMETPTGRAVARRSSAAGESAAAAAESAKTAASDAVATAKASVSRTIASMKDPMPLPSTLGPQNGLAQALDPETARGTGSADLGTDTPAAQPAPATATASATAPPAATAATSPPSTPGALGDAPTTEVASAKAEASSPPVEAPKAASKTSRVTLPDGTERVVSDAELGPAPSKPRGLSKQAKAAVAAYKLDQAMGLGMVPETKLATLDGKTVVTQAPATGESPAALLAAKDPVLDSAAHKHSLADARAFDYVAGNRSRGDNYLVDPATGKITLTDNSLPGSGKSARPTEVTQDFVAKAAQLNDPKLASKVQGVMTADQLKAAQARAQELSDGLLDGSVTEVP
jgi:hypothetical protein